MRQIIEFSEMFYQEAHAEIYCLRGSGKVKQIMAYVKDFWKILGGNGDALT